MGHNGSPDFECHCVGWTEGLHPDSEALTAALQIY